MSLNTRVVERLKEEKDKRHLTFQDIAAFCGWNRTKVTKKFGEETALTLDEFEALCFAVNLSPTEAVRDRGLEFCAEMTPTELRRHERFRLLPKPTVDAIDHLLDVQAKKGVELRGATARREKLGKPRSA